MNDLERFREFVLSAYRDTGFHPSGFSDFCFWTGEVAQINMDHEGLTIEVCFDPDGNFQAIAVI